ncbi:hypothetical protein GCM10022197_37840 [Microlunatus spumicola]|uniref:Copper resistance protein D domain-containing protein n=1 Tax=Microlunatus spumicola TaxID=81499 RepID=A0ABP6Y5U6_9ACTN
MTVLGLPLHPLIVHATVVAVPAAALSVLLVTIWPRFRHWASWGPAALAAVALVLVPITTSSGETLEHTLPSTPLIEAHTHLADGLLPWVIALLVGALLVLWPQLAVTRPRMWALPRWLVVGGMVVASVAAVGALVEVVLIGHSGAAAAWSQNA